jgi:transposase
MTSASILTKEARDEAIVRLRQVGMTVAEIAAATGVSKSTVSNVTAGTAISNTGNKTPGRQRAPGAGRPRKPKAAPSPKAPERYTFASRVIRKDIHRALRAKGLSVRQIAATTSTPLRTVERDIADPPDGGPVEHGDPPDGGPDEPGAIEPEAEEQEEEPGLDSRPSHAAGGTPWR